MNHWNGMMLGLLAVAAAVGCDGASAARETDRIAAGSSTSLPDVQSPRGAPPNAAPDNAPTAQVAAPAASLAAGGIVETTFDDIKFPMEKTDDFVESMLTDQVRNLFGKRIRIRGYMFPTHLRKGIKQFVLVRDNMECCFGPGAALFDCVLVTMVGGATAEFSIRPIAVEGEFRLEVLPGPDGRPLAIYQMAGEAVN